MVHGRLLFLSFLASLAAACGGEAPTSTAPQAETEHGASAETPLRDPEDPPTARRRTLDELREDHHAERHASDGAGRAWLELGEGEDGSVGASQAGTWTIVYEAGPEGVAVGGSVRFLTPPFWEWSSAQDFDEEGTGYTTVESLAEGVELELFVGEWTVAGIGGRRLEAGERLRFVYGAGPAGARADRYAERGARFWISVDGDGDGVPGILHDSPAIDVHPGEPARLQLIAESVARPGEPFRLRVSVLDRAGNAGTSFDGIVRLASETELLSLPDELAYSAADRGTKAIDVKCRTPGVVRVSASADLPRGTVETESNPVLVSEQAPRVFWGDLHGHSHLSDGTGEPEDYFAYARDVAGLDVVALTDHDHWGVLFLDQNPEMWSRIRTVTERFHDPGSFVTLLGYEWTNWVHGHRHVLYFGDDGPVLSSIDPDYETPAQLWDGLRATGLEALTFAHHSAGGPIATDWSFPPDPEFEPVTEIVSVHGSSEASDGPLGIYRPLRGNYVRDVLDRGFQLGFIGSGDSHDGHPGLAHLASRTGGLAAILGDELTRDGIRGALQARRTYATNGARILLQCALSGQRMGSSVTPPPEGEAAGMFLRVIACAPLEFIDIVRSGSVQRIPAEGRLDVSLEVQVPALEPGEYVYVRAIQEDRFAAWSSPFFVVEPEAPETDEEDAQDETSVPEETR